MEEEDVDHRYARALEKSWEEFSQRDLEELAELSGGTLEGDKLNVDILNRTAVVDPSSKTIAWSDGSDIDDDVKVLLLHYILRSAGRVEGKPASYREFPGGELYYSVFQGRAIMPLIKTFGERAEALATAGEKLGASRAPRGDASIDLRFFPYVPINITVWEGDDEVPASANILFDSIVGSVMPAEDLAHLSAELVKMLRDADREG